MLLVAVLAALVSTVAAQNVLLVEYGGKTLLVRGADGIRPKVEIEGKLVAVPGYRFALRQVEEYLPVFISVRNMEVRTTYSNVVGTASEVNHEFHFRARFETPYRLDDVYVVLELETERAGKVLFLYRVGRLDPNDTKPVSITAPLAFPLGSGHFRFHIFMGGAEVMHSEIPFPEREAALDRMVTKRIESVKDAEVKLFIGPAPDFPSSMGKAKTKGQAAIALRIGTTGRVLDPVIKSATDPVFGEAALAAVRMWRFLPKVKDGHPVETPAVIPFVFTPPALEVTKQ